MADHTEALTALREAVAAKQAFIEANQDPTPAEWEHYDNDVADHNAAIAAAAEELLATLDAGNSADTDDEKGAPR